MSSIQVFEGDGLRNYGVVPGDGIVIAVQSVTGQAAPLGLALGQFCYHLFSSRQSLCFVMETIKPYYDSGEETFLEIQWKSQETRKKRSIQFANVIFTSHENVKPKPRREGAVCELTFNGRLHHFYG